MDIDASAGRRILAAASPAFWQLSWLCLHLLVRELLVVAESPTARDELKRCAELRRALIQAGWFN